MSSFTTDVRISFRREILPTLRGWPYQLFGLVQPLLYLVLFVPALGGGDGTMTWFVPGMVVMLVLFTTAMCGWTLTEELMSGSLERLLATAMSRPALLVGRALKELAPLFLQSIVVIAIAVPLGMSLAPAHILLGLLLLLVFGIGVAALSYALAIAAKRDGSLVYMVTHSISLPLMLLGGVLLPLDAAPRWLYIASRFNPLTYLVDAERALFACRLDTTVALGAAVAATVAIVGLAVGTRTIRRASL